MTQKSCAVGMRNAILRNHLSTIQFINDWQTRCAQNPLEPFSLQNVTKLFSYRASLVSVSNCRQGNRCEEVPLYSISHASWPPCFSNPVLATHSNWLALFLVHLAANRISFNPFCIFITNLTLFSCTCTHSNQRYATCRLGQDQSESCLFLRNWKKTWDFSLPRRRKTSWCYETCLRARLCAMRPKPPIWQSMGLLPASKNHKTPSECCGNRRRWQGRLSPGEIRHEHRSVVLLAFHGCQTLQPAGIYWLRSAVLSWQVCYYQDMVWWRSDGFQ